MDRPRFSPPLGVVVFVVGAGSLGAEIAAARLLAPSFGASTVVWANTIATVLVALSVGYWYGGRLADRDPTYPGLFRIVLLAAVLMAVVPFVADPFLDLAVDALDSISAGAFVGSLLAVLALVAVPVFVLGMVAPYALRLGVGSLEEAGRVSGRLYAISTIGSLCGTFLSALLLIPLVGTRRTFLVFALSLAVVAALGLGRRRLLGVPAAVVLLMALPVGTVKATDRGRVVHEADTEYQYARVIEDDDGDRYLEQLNEGQAIHSLTRKGSFLTGDYWDEYLVMPFAGRSRPVERMAILGNAGGTIARGYGHFFPDTAIDGVEIDAEVSEIGRKWLDMRNPRLTTFAEDARPFLRRTDERYDAIVVDAYRQPYIPFYLTTKEFFALARSRLRPGGMVLVNVGHPERSTKLEQVLSATMDEVFGSVARDPSEDTNTVLVGSDEEVSSQRLYAAVASLPPALQPIARAAAARLKPRLDGGEVYTDDKAPVEWLIDTSIVEVAARGER